MGHKCEIPRLSKDEMRNIVRLRLANEIMFSDEVSPDLIGMVFMPIPLGALRPPKEILIEVLGSEFPPEALEGEPPKPQHPGYQDKAGDPPPKPVLAKLPEKVRAGIEWGYIPEEEWGGLLAQVREENEKKIRDWEEASMRWMDLLDQDSKNRKEVDALYERALKEWESSLAQHEEAVREREALKADWVEKSKALYAEWTQDIGVIMGNMKDTFPRSINGYPIFHSFNLIHKEDWVRIREAIAREQERAKEIEI